MTEYSEMDCHCSMGGEGGRTEEKSEGGGREGERGRKGRNRGGGKGRKREREAHVQLHTLAHYMCTC